MSQLFSNVDILGEGGNERKIRERQEKREAEIKRQKQEDRRNREHYQKHYGMSQDQRLKQKIPESNHDFKVVKGSRRADPTPREKPRRKKKKGGFTPRRTRAIDSDKRGSRASANDGLGSRASSMRSSRHVGLESRAGSIRSKGMDGRTSSLRDNYYKREAGIKDPIERASTMKKRDQARVGGVEVEDDDPKSRFRKRTWSEAKRHSKRDQAEKRDSARRSLRKTSEPVRRKRDEKGAESSREPWHLASSNPFNKRSGTSRSNRLDEMNSLIEDHQKRIEEQRKAAVCGTWEYEIRGMKSQYTIEVDKDGDLMFTEDIQGVGLVKEVLLYTDGWYSLYSRKYKFYVRLKLMGDEMLSQFRTQKSKSWSSDCYAKKIEKEVFE